MPSFFAMSLLDAIPSAINIPSTGILLLSSKTILSTFFFPLMESIFPSMTFCISIDLFSGRWLPLVNMLTLSVTFFKTSASWSAYSPLPITATFLFLKKKPSHILAIKAI